MLLHPFFWVPLQTKYNLFWVNIVQLTSLLNSCVEGCDLIKGKGHMWPSLPWHSCALWSPDRHVCLDIEDHPSMGEASPPPPPPPGGLVVRATIASEWVAKLSAITSSVSGVEKGNAHMAITLLGVGMVEKHVFFLYLHTSPLYTELLYLEANWIMGQKAQWSVSDEDLRMALIIGPESCEKKSPISKWRMRETSVWKSPHLERNIVI